ncbi:hypothetical protein B0H13DRAFT_1600253, partial [Mycena leptocephala]
LHILHRTIASDAFHDSAERYPQPKCHPETRTELLDKLWNWTCLVCEKCPRMIWLYGPAGAGKSAVMQSFCQKLESEGCLGGAFFFKRGHPSRGNGNKLLSTIAYQLSLALPELKHAICQVVEDDPSITHRSLSLQLQRLIIEPCQQNLCGRTLVIIIDGLDECEDQNIQQEILCSIGRAIDKQQLSLRFLVASRPEAHLRDTFTGVLHRIHCPVNIEQSFEDVRKFLLHEFARIYREHHKTMAIVPCPWPSPEIIDNLVNKSSGYFIYASTVIKFIDDKDFRPTERLKVIMGTKEPDFGSPFVALDGLYTQILSQVHARPQLLKILTIIVDFSFKPGDIEQLLELEPGDVQLTLRGLHSVIRILEEVEQDDAYIIFFHHASFRDFLKDPRRAGIFYIGSCPHRTDLSRHILKAWTYMHDHPSSSRKSHVSW